MPILPMTPKLHHFQNNVVFVLESGVKLAFYYDFLYGMGKVRENQTLIHLSEILNVLKIFIKVTKIQRR
jgi:hypothetical protein